METRERLWNKNFIIICIAYFLVACSFHLLMPTIPLFLSEKLHVPNSKIGIVLSSYALALLIVRPFSGYLVDIFSRKSLLIIGIVLYVSTYIGYYFAFTVTFFFILRFVHGMFWGLSTVSANTVAVDIIPESRRAEGIGYFGVNSNIAMAIAPFIAVNIYENYGFNVLISSALFMGILSIAVVWTIKVPKRPKVIREMPVSLDRFILIKGLPIMFNQLLISFGWGTLVAFAVLYGKTEGIQNAGVFFLFLASGIILSRVTSGKFVDRGYLHQVMVLALLVISLGFLSFAFLNSVVFYSISAFLIGIGYGTLFPALQTLYINMALSSQRGTANSTYLTGFDLGISIGMLLGAVISEKVGFSFMYMLSGVFCMMALVIYWINSRPVYERNKIVAS
ncbi:MAG: MFS transporter [Chitinophagales bacterium]|nr:MFS transporter [Chitinophagales bacterium]